MKQRVEWIDTTKAIGIFLVFYGHYVEVIGRDYGSTAGMSQFKFIYSFHIPLFFVLAGFFFKENNNKLSKIKSLFHQRIIPVIAFGVLFIPLWLVYNKVKFHTFLSKSIADKALFYLGGDPQLNIITWFLVCLFTTEVIVALLNFKSANNSKNALSGVFFLILGYFLTGQASYLTTYTKLGVNFWYIHESIVAMGFYLIGNWLYAFISSLEAKKSSLLRLLIPASLLILLLSNTLFSSQDIVVISISKHGNLLPFIINALAGTLLIIGIGRLVPSSSIIKFYGVNTLILLGLNGFFFHFINRQVIKLTLIDKSPAYVTINCLVVTLLSLALCYPMVYLFDKYLPQLFGKPYVNGPIIKSVDRLFEKQSLELIS